MLQPVPIDSILAYRYLYPCKYDNLDFVLRIIVL